MLCSIKLPTHFLQLVMQHQNWGISFPVAWVTVKGIATKLTLSDCSLSKHGTLKCACLISH